MVVATEQAECGGELRSASHPGRARIEGVAAVFAGHGLALGSVVARHVRELHGVALRVRVGHELVRNVAS